MSTTISGIGDPTAGFGKIESKLTNRRGNDGWTVGVSVEESTDTT
jgi:hypothetical protein